MKVYLYNTEKVSWEFSVLEHDVLSTAFSTKMPL